MNTKKFKSTLLLFVLGLAVVFTVNYALADWTPPTTTPPTCPAGQPGCDVPINVGTVDQVKNGGLSVNAFSAYMNAWFEQTVSIKGSIGGATGTPASPTPATLEVTTPLKVDDLSSNNSGQPVCAGEDGTLTLCNQSGGVQVASQYGISITGISGIPGFTLPYTVSGSTQVSNAPHNASATPPSDIVLTVQGSQNMQPQTVTLNIYAPNDTSKVYFTSCYNINSRYNTFSDPHTLDFSLIPATDTNTFTTTYEQNPGFNPYQEISIIASTGNSSSCQNSSQL